MANVTARDLRLRIHIPYFSTLPGITKDTSMIVHFEDQKGNLVIFRNNNSFIDPSPTKTQSPQSTSQWEVGCGPIRAAKSMEGGEGPKERHQERLSQEGPLRRQPAKCRHSEQTTKGRLRGHLRRWRKGLSQPPKIKSPCLTSAGKTDWPSPGNASSGLASGPGGHACLL